MPHKTPVIRPCDIEPERIDVLVLDGLDRAEIVTALHLFAQETESDAIAAVSCQQWKLAQSLKQRAMQRHQFAAVLEQAERVRG